MVKALITGFTGFIGSEVALTALKRGHTIRGTTRTAAKAKAWIEKHPEFKSKIEFVIVEDMTAPGVWDEVVEGLEWAFHVAYPMTGKFGEEVNESGHLKPAIEGNLGLLRAAAKTTTVKKVVITSSYATCFFTPEFFNNGIIDEKLWMPASYEEAAKSENPFYVYAASKTLAEKAAWDFVEKEKPSFTLTTIIPPYVYGPSSTVAEKGPLAHTNGHISRLFNPNVDVGSLYPMGGGPVVADVRDVAEAHLLAAEIDQAGGERIGIAGEKSFPADYVRILRNNFPDHLDELPQVPADYEEPSAYTIDASKSVRVLGIKYRSLEETITDTARYAIAMRA